MSDDIFNNPPTGPQLAPDPTSGTPPSGERKERIKKLLRIMRQPWAIVAFAAVLMALVLGFSINRIMIALLHSRPEVVVPRLEGKNLMDALGIVSPFDLSLQQEGTDFDESLPAGTVLRQYPPPGMKVRAGRAIRVLISKGGQLVFVPAIDGKPIAEAQSVLATDGLQMGAVSESYSTDFAKGTVISQSPSSGTVSTRGALIDVEISKGLPPVGLPLVPDFFGKTPQEAQDWATGVRATVKIKENPKAIGPAGTIVKSDPPAGQPLLEGQELQLTIVPISAGSGSRLTFEVPKDSPADSTVRIMARDNRGESLIYEGKHAGGAVVEIPIGINTTTRFRIYVNDLLTEERVVEAQ